jgi:hypothetical protein
MALSLWGAVVGAESVADPLARVEFDKEITLKLPAADIVRIYRTVSGLTRVPFIIELEPDPRVKTDFMTEQTPARAVLVSLASAHGLEYLATPEGIAVRRKGMPPSAKPIVVGSWPGPQVRLWMEVRGTDGRVMSTPTVTTQMGQPMEMKQGVERGNRRAHIVLKLTPIRESGSALECEMEVMASRSISPTRWIEDHRKETVTAGKDETILVTTDDGIQVVLTRWQRTTP